MTLATIVLNQIGWDGAAVVLPVFADGQLVNVRRREVSPGAKPRGLTGRGSHLYPSTPEDKSILLVAGEFDALIARQHGLPAVTTTTGASLPEHLRAVFAGRRVAVAYDVGEEASARRTVAALEAHSADAWVAELPLPNHGDDLTDWFVTYGRTAGELRTLLNQGARR